MIPRHRGTAPTPLISPNGSILRILAVHSTTPHLAVAVTEKDRVVGEKVLPAGREHLENLAPTIDDLTQALGIRLEQLDAFAVARGPGSFSGIRVGLATVKGMALALGKPVMGITSLEILAWQGLGKGDPVISVIDARRKDIYVALYDKGRTYPHLLKGPSLISREKFKSFVENAGKKVVLSGDSRVQDLAAVSPLLLMHTVSAPSAAGCGILGWRRFTAGQSDEIHSLAPLYLRRSDAEEKKKPGLLL